jgi:hypothetical protein
MQSNPLERWLNLFSESFIEKIIPEIQEKDVVNLLKFTKEKNRNKIRKIANQMYHKIGYANK